MLEKKNQRKQIDASIEPARSRLMPIYRIRIRFFFHPTFFIYNRYKKNITFRSPTVLVIKRFRMNTA